MNTPEPPTDADRTIFGELRDRLWAARTQESAARTEARRLGRELALARRLLRFYVGAVPASGSPAATPAAVSDTVLLSDKVIYHVDACENLGSRTAISGWAFRPAPGWDARAVNVFLLLRHDDTAYMTACQRVQRADVAALYAGRPPALSGGARGLNGAGFAGEVRHDALPAGTEWKIVLRLEYAGQACEQFTGEFLRL